MELILQRPQRKENVKKYCILYVDDEPVNLRIFQHAFKRDYVVHTALNGFDALDILNDEKIDLVITDQQMPRMSGVDLLAKIVPKHPSIVRMIMTGFSDIGAIIRAVNEFGLDKYLVKPWDRDQLKVEFDKALEKKEKEKSSPTSEPKEEILGGSKMQLSFLQSKVELDSVFSQTSLIYDESDNRNGYWVGEKNGIKYAISYYVKNNDSSSFVVNSFVPMTITELIYKESKDSAVDLLEGLVDKFKLRFGPESTMNEMDLAIIKYDSNAEKLTCVGANMDMLYINSEDELERVKGQQTALNLKNSPKVYTEVELTGVQRLLMISKNVIEYEFPAEIKGANGKSFQSFIADRIKNNDADIFNELSEELSCLDKKMVLSIGLK